MATHSTTLAWRIPWTEEPGGLWSMGSQRIGHDLVTKQLQQAQPHHLKKKYRLGGEKKIIVCWSVWESSVFSQRVNLSRLPDVARPLEGG